jgi:hypothetical protein
MSNLSYQRCYLFLASLEVFDLFLASLEVFDLFLASLEVFDLFFGFGLPCGFLFLFWPWFLFCPWFWF